MTATTVLSFLVLLGLSLPLFLCFVSIKLTGSGFHKIILFISLIFVIIFSFGFINLLHLELGFFFKSLFYWPIVVGLMAGNILFTMILGHYYLVVPKLTVKPLLLNLKFLFGLLVTRLLIVFFYGQTLSFWKSLLLVFFPASLFLSSGSDVGLGEDVFKLVLFLFQQISCYVAIPILAVFSYKLCLMRSTQSATGIFYVMVFFSFVGDLVTLYFYYNNGVMI